MILSFKDPDVKLLWETGATRRIPAVIRRTALRKLVTLNWAKRLDDLSVPGGNRLEALRGDRKGQHSIRINDQFRLCFKWLDGNASDVEIVDYH